MNGNKQNENSDSPRSSAEWVSLAVSLILLAGLIAIVAWLWLNSSGMPASFRVEQGAVRNERGQFYLPVHITNDGEVTATEVKVEGLLASSGQEERSDTTFDFIPAHSTVEGVLIFSQNPANATVRVLSYQLP